MKGGQDKKVPSCFAMNAVRECVRVGGGLEEQSVNVLDR